MAKLNTTGRRMTDPNDEEIDTGVDYGDQVVRYTPVKEVVSLYKEVRNPQAPVCLHVWRSSWGFSGPIMVCDKCGEWHHD